MTGAAVKIITKENSIARELRAAIRSAQARVARGTASVAAAAARVAELEVAATAPGASAGLRRTWSDATLLLENAKARRQRGVDLVETLTRQLAALPADALAGAAIGRPPMVEGQVLKLLSLRVPESDAVALGEIAHQRYETAAAVLRRYVREGLERDGAVVTGGA